MQMRRGRARKYYSGVFAAIILITLVIFANWLTTPFNLLDNSKPSQQFSHTQDRQRPAIELKGDNPGLFCKGQAYKEAGYTATDDRDGDLTSKVKKTITNGKIIYSVTDSSGNKTSISRGLQPHLKNRPTIELTGGSVQIFVGANYAEPGYEATDICDGNLASEVKVENPVNTSQAGIYKLKYSIKNSSGNVATTERTVEVKPLPSQNGVIYLTFDDGPSSVTAQILDTLKEEGVKASFFIIGASSSLDYLIRRAYQEGHTIAAHSYTHRYRQIYASETAFFNDLNMIQDKIASITGKKSPFIRFPGGSSNTVSRFNPGIMTRLAAKVKAQGYTYFDWNVSSGDADSAKTASGVYDNVVGGLSINRSNIVLLHDLAGNIHTANALKNIIKFGKDHGYQFAPITAETIPHTHKISN